MHLHSENILLVGSILLLLSILGGKTTSRWGVPTLIFFLLVGILAGSAAGADGRHHSAELHSFFGRAKH